MSVQICPGCQGRNVPDAELCDWCARPFREGRGRFTLRWWHLATVGLFGMVIAAVAALLLLSASRPDLRQPVAGPPPGPAAAGAPAPPALPTRAATVVVVGAPTPISQPKPAASPTPIPAAAAAAPPASGSAPAPATARLARVANTGGLGVYLRQEAGPQGERLQPALAEGTVLRLVGPEETVQAQVWRLCELEARGVQGWVAAQYLQPTDALR